MTSAGAVVAPYVIVLRLVAAALPLAVLPADPRVAVVVILTVALALLLNYAGLRRWEWVLARLQTRAGKVYLAVDVALGLALLARLGTGSPFVLYTIGTAALSGLLFRRVTTTVVVSMLLCGYLLVHTLQTGLAPGSSDFHTSVTLPVLYVFAAGGAVVLRRVLAQQEAQAREVAALAQVSAVSQERLRLSRDLHDSLTKSLHGLSLMTQALGRAADSGDVEAVGRNSALIARVLDEVSVEARRTVAGLRDDSDDELMLGEALRARASRDLGGAELDVQVAPYTEPALAVRLELLAVVDEALENVRRHARATRVRLGLHDDEQGALVLTVADDGKGFDPAAAADRVGEGHFGLVGMRERAERAGAQFRVESSPGRGTELLVRRPAAHEALVR